ncbi:uroporphyrinogen-III synthase [Buchnera aphidicola (Macrosiphoniella sanborni)]|uniref:Uroporphyrinogen-III synthase n=1 Tax=Buchnera aphidicola (Macrosiphoniella sanborni) TaxID=1241865 RepID=A0A4D6YI63_9GAMM|nr:uroporphyrinogen-III synthase [Buchnera aphidicola]QCI24085.1 uroporphyrinogen-III synthase [Buchnera aphidicola (Macrosiphoniella sanborni)]
MLYKNILNSSIKKNKIVLLQGENGRNFIAKELKYIGCNVNLIECYKRVLKILDIYEEVKKWRLYGINTLIITNGETLNQLKKIVSDTNQIQWLLKCKIFVIGKRLSTLAKKLGWHKIIISNYANNHFLLQVIKKNRINFSAKEDLNL